MCIVINLDVVCLICLQHGKQMYSIYTPPDAEHHDELPIAQKICILSELKLDEQNETMPDKICNKCLEDLKVAWRFHKNCQAAKTIFQTIIGGDKPAPAEELVMAENKIEVARELDEQNIRVPQGLQIKLVENDDLREEGKSRDSNNYMDATKVRESEVNKKSPAIDYELAKDNSTLYEDLVQQQDLSKDYEETEEFQALAEVGEEELEEGDELVEFYLTDDGVQEEQMHDIEKVVAAALSKKFEKSRAELKNDTKTLFKSSKTEIKPENLVIGERSKETSPKLHNRGRPRQHEFQKPLELPKTSKHSMQEQKKEQETTRPKIVKQIIVQNNPKIAQKQQQQQQLVSNSAPQSDLKHENTEDSSNAVEVKPVRARKRKSKSPETKAPKICDICGNSYRFQHALNAHMRRHFNDKPFPCEMCEKAFVSNVELRRHMRVHTGAKPYACQYCERRFSDFGSRIKHERTHTGERPYVCATCGKAFAYAHVLSVHERIHTGEKRFRCEHCSKGFTKKAYLLSHVEQHHMPPKPKSIHIVLDDDTMDEEMDEAMDNNSQMVPMKSVAFEECIYTTEFLNDPENNIPVVDEGDEEDYCDEDYDTDIDQQIIIKHTLLQPKMEHDNNMEHNNDDDENVDGDVHEIVEIHPDEYSIRVR